MELISEIVSYLSDCLETPVATQRPQNPPSEMVTVVRTGGEGDRFTDDAEILLHCWAESDIEALNLMNRAAWAMLELPDNSLNVAYVNQNSMYSNVYTDGTPRWSALFDLVTNRMKPSL